MTDLRLPTGRTLVAYAIPSMHMETSQGTIQASFRQTAIVNVETAQSQVAYREIAQVEVETARILVAVRGRVDNPELRIWTFTLDEHDLIVLRLGDSETIVYDTTSEQWVDWDSSETGGVWRANTGMTWIGGQALGHTYGSAVVVGDDTYGLLWLLDPQQAYDDAPDTERGPQQREFQRIVTGQVLAKNRQFLPCYVIFLDGDNYGLTAIDFTPGATLEYSDDQGRNFVSAGTIEADDVIPDEAYLWTSLGQISSPGRIFRVTDNGVFARIDTMSMNDDG